MAKTSQQKTSESKPKGKVEALRPHADSKEAALERVIRRLKSNTAKVP